MKLITFLIMILLTIPTIGCVSQRPIDLRIDSGRPMPNPSYTLFDTQGMGYSTTFYIASMKEQIDLDGTEHLNPEFLYIPINKTFSVKNYKSIILKLEIWNGNERSYTLMERQTVILVDNKKTQHYLQVASSNLKYRQYTIELPFNEDINEVIYSIELMEDGNIKPIFRVGDLYYKIHRKGGTNF